MYIKQQILAHGNRHLYTKDSLQKPSIHSIWFVWSFRKTTTFSELNANPKQIYLEKETIKLSSLTIFNEMLKFIFVNAILIRIQWTFRC